MKTSEQVDKLYPAFIAFQSEVPSVLKDGNNPHFKSKYATLPAITESVRPYLAKHGLGFTQSLAYREGVQLIFTRVMHTSGQWMEDEGYILNPTKNDPQGMASAVTYARRNTLGATCGIITEDDDDGNKASAPQATPPPKLAPIPKATKPMPDWFNDNGELNDHGKKAGEAVANGTKWADIEKKYHIDSFTRGVVDAYASSLKNASQILAQADAIDDDLPFK